MKKFRGIHIKSAAEIELMREANRIVAEVLDAIGREVEPGMPTMFFEELALSQCRKNNVRPAFKGYKGFPFALCCSVNEEVVHGFPSDRVLQEGDIVSFDMGVVYRKYYGDAARTFTVGEVSGNASALVETTRATLMEGVREARPGNYLVDISRAIQKHAESRGYSVIKRFVGHGIGLNLHEKPEVPNFVTDRAMDLPLRAGMVLAIEPMLTLGGSQVRVLEDRWTAVTADGTLSAHFEHTVAITDDGPDILSLNN